MTDTDKRPTVSARLDKDLHARLQAAADERVVSVSLLVEKAVEDYLDRLVPLDELLRTRGARFIVPNESRGDE